jgi:hypothetical protein
MFGKLLEINLQTCSRVPCIALKQTFNRTTKIKGGLSSKIDSATKPLLMTEETIQISVLPAQIDSSTKWHENQSIT